MPRPRRLLSALVPVLVLAAPLAQAQLARIGEIRLDNVGGVDEEYLEIQGPPGTSLTGLSIVVLGDEFTDGSGAVERVIDLVGQVIPPDGHFLIADGAGFGNGSLGLAGSVDLAVPLGFEDGNNRTFLLVDGLHPDIVPGSDVDQDADGAIDSPCNCTVPPGPPWTAVVDAVATLNTPGGGNLTYAPVQVGPDGTDAPAQIYRCNASPFDWRMGAPDSGTTDTPGTPNGPVCAPLLSREEATQIFLGTLDPGDPDSATTAAYLYLKSDPVDSTLHPGDLVNDADSTFFQAIVNPTYLFWVDYQVDHWFGHRAGFVFVDAANGTPVAIEAASWPVVNGTEVDTFLVDNEISPDLVFGDGFVGDALPVALFNPEPQPASANWGIIVGGRNLHGGDNPDQSAIEGDAARGYRYLNGSGFGGPQIDPANIDTLVGRPPRPGGQPPYPGTGASAEQIKQALCDLGNQPTRCDKLYFFYFGHGTRSGKIVVSSKTGGSKDYVSYRDLASWIKKANAKEVCILMMGCYTGTSIDAFAREGLTGTVITSSDISNPTYRQSDGSAFMYGFLRCFLTPLSDLNGDGHKTMPEILAWTFAASDSANEKKPQAVTLDGGNKETIEPPVCYVHDERIPRKSQTPWIDAPWIPRPIGGGTGTRLDGENEESVEGRMIYEVKEFSYDDAAAGAETEEKKKRRFYAQNPLKREQGQGHLTGTVRPAFKVNVYCVKKDGSENPIQRIFTELEGERRFCYFAVPDECVKLRLERGPAVGPGKGCPPSVPWTGDKPGVLGGANVLDLDTVVGHSPAGAYDRGDLVLASRVVAADSLTGFTAEAFGPPGWNAVSDPSAPFFIPSGCDTEMVFVRADVPDTATSGAVLSLRVVESATLDTLETEYLAMLVDTLGSPIGSGTDAYAMSLHTEHGAAISGGAASFHRTAVNLRGSADFAVSGGAALTGLLTSVYVDSAASGAFTVEGSTVDLRHCGIVGADDGIELDDVTGTLYGVASLASRGDGVRLAPGDYAALSVESLQIDEAAGDGLVLDGATGVVMRGLEVSAAGGQDLRVENGSALELVDGVFDPGAVTVDPASSLVRSWTRLYRAAAANGDSLAGAVLTVVDALGDTVATGTTGSDGYLDVLELPEWGTAGGSTTDYSPYTVHASFGLFDTTLVDTVDAPLGVSVVFSEIGSATGVPEPGPSVTLRLGRNFPNPFRDETSLSFSLPVRGRTVLEVLDTAGRRVATVIDEDLPEGEHRIPWTAGEDLASGVYYLRLSAAGHSLARKLLLLR